MKQFKRTLLVFCLIFLLTEAAFAHFGMVIPSDNMVMKEDSKKVDLVLSFSHPFEMVGMPLDMPGEFFVMADGKKEDLKAALKEAKVMDHKAWTLGYTVKNPGPIPLSWRRPLTGNRPRTASSSIIPKPWWRPLAMTGAGMKSWA